jgi:hypothetical protein
VVAAISYHSGEHLIIPGFPRVVLLMQIPQWANSQKDETGRGVLAEVPSWYLQCLRKIPIHAIGIGMAFIVLRRTRGTRGYYLVETYRDERGTARKRTLCYLGR